MKEKDALSVKKANVFISHAWKYNFLGVVDAINQHFKDETDVTIWFDVFSVNQHATDTYGDNTDWWAESFKNAVKEIGRVVVILHPWENPIPFTRAWCLWEIYCAISLLEEDKLQIAMSSTTKKSICEWFD